MTNALPAPLVTPNVVLRDFAYMPLDVVRLRDSRLAAEVSAEEFRCAVILWCVAWHQVPAGSLPDDDTLLAKYAGFGRSTREWKKHRAGALHGWVKCSDGRLYHPVVAEKAIEAQLARDTQAYKTECARIKKQSQRSQVAAEYPTFDEWLSHLRETGQTKWRPQKASKEAATVPADRMKSPEDNAGTNNKCPEMSRSNGREGKGREGISILPDITSAAPSGNTERAKVIAGALRGYGYQVEAGSIEVVRLVEISATDAEIAEASSKAKGLLRLKPLTWVISRIEGRRIDAAQSGAGPAPQPAIDPTQAAIADADRTRDDAIIDARHMGRLGRFTADEVDRKIAEAKAAHSAVVAQLGAVA